MILLRESDRPKSLGEKISEALGKPPMPVLRFYGDFSTEMADGKRHLLFAVRNGMPLPLFYGIYVRTSYDSFTDYIEKTDHIGPWSIDDWRLTLDTTGPAQVEIRVGLLPFEILTDRVEVLT
ncbi:unnamed protein product [marine sediment metagenome]|uniref:Uncharacterized protein n=1 Tax=marine sediment metagenome TaxID=412755 RepID=X1HSZ0_9ZZZZ